jgi:hypothetical protein
MMSITYAQLNNKRMGMLGTQGKPGFELFLRVPPAGFPFFYRALRFPARGFGVEASNQ